MNPLHRRNDLRFTREFLLRTRRRLFRRRAWFALLNRAERGIINLTIRCVREVKSLTLTRTLLRLFEKVSQALKSEFLENVRRIGSPLAKQVSEWAYSWGNKGALEWRKDFGFIMYLALTHVNPFSSLKGAGHSSRRSNGRPRPALGSGA